MNRRSTDRPPGQAPRGVEHLAVAVLPSVLVVLALLLASASPLLAPEGVAAAPFELLGFVLVSALAALHRAFFAGPTPAAELPSRAASVSLGLGSLVLPAVAVRQGAVAAALCAFLSLLVAEVAHRALVRRLGSELPAGRLSAVLERAVLIAFVTLLAAAASIHPQLLATVGLGTWPWAAGGAAVYGVGYCAAVWGLARLRRHAFEAHTVLL
ncbi:MAG: hypothetical protein MI919_41040, partial [Holophagales bacterium]|nr:hypothetical protein [Holophagales bacterium]